MRNNTIEFFLALVRFGIGHQKGNFPYDTDWSAIEIMAEQQGLSAIIVDGLEKIQEDKRPPKEQLLQWIGTVLQEYEYRYDCYRKAIAELAGWYNAHGFKMMVLKGYSCSMDWPKPEHRPCGDIDIWLFGKQEEADNLLEKEKKIKVEGDQHHHTIFYWNDFMVENHYDFINVHAHRSSRKLESIFKEMGSDDSHFFVLNGEKLYLPSPNFHALFLIRHAASHFAAEGINLRQVLDWAFFVEKHTKEINWPWLISLLEKYHMKDFYNCINAICVEDLGFPVNMFTEVQFYPNLKERILNDILMPQYEHEPPDSLIPRLFFKWKRWRDNEWKRELCYKEGGLSSFATGMWAHIMKPKSI